MPTPTEPLSVAIKRTWRMACHRAVFFLSHRSVRIATLSRSSEHSSQERGGHSVPVFTSCVRLIAMVTQPASPELRNLGPARPRVLQAVALLCVVGLGELRHPHHVGDTHRGRSRASLRAGVALGPTTAARCTLERYQLSWTCQCPKCWNQRKLRFPFLAPCFPSLWVTASSFFICDYHNHLMIIRWPACRCR